MFPFFTEEIIKEPALTLKEHPALCVEKKTLVKSASAVSKMKKVNRNFLFGEQSFHKFIIFSNLALLKFIQNL